MQKKKFDLTSEIVEVSLGEDKVKNLESNIEIKKKNILMTISVEEEVRKEFKVWCARKGLKMHEAFIKGFALLKKQDYT